MYVTRFGGRLWETRIQGFDNLELQEELFS